MGGVTRGVTRYRREGYRLQNTFQNGAKKVAKSISWSALNLFSAQNDTICVRRCDALLLAAWTSDGAATAATVEVTGPATASYGIADGGSVPHRFDLAGDYRTKVVTTTTVQ